VRLAARDGNSRRLGLQRAPRTKETATVLIDRGTELERRLLVVLGVRRNDAERPVEPFGGLSRRMLYALVARVGVFDAAAALKEGDDASAAAELDVGSGVEVVVHRTTRLSQKRSSIRDEE
jgi:hypothetical protein